ncbi:MAG: riboflavin synthase [Rhodothermales bacterium]
MFTGIIEAVGTITAVRDLGGGKRLTIAAPFADELRVDESVAVNGACQTVVAQTNETFEVIAVEETLRKTTLGQFRVGRPVNLERAMRPTGRLDGHIVQGHVDTTGTVVSVKQEQTNWLYTIRFPERFASYVIPVGSIALDGISLTVARLDGHTATVAIIPHTYTHTIIHMWKPGDAINIEFDMIGKYVVGWLERTNGQGGGIIEAWLKAQG